MATEKKILITGNGFDLYHKLPTKFIDLIYFLMKIENLELYNENYEISEILQSYTRVDELDNLYNISGIHIKKREIEKIQSILSNNSWYKLLKKKTQFENWIDIENEIKYTLLLINEVVDRIESHIKINGNVLIKSNIPEHLLFKINSNEEEYLDTFKVILKNEDKIDFNPFYLNFVNDEVINFKKDELLNHLYIELENFIGLFDQYLMEVVEKLLINIKEDLKNFKIPNFESFDYYFNFNYTSTLEKIYNRDTVKINYLHGTCGDKLNRMVLGIDDFDNKTKNSNELFLFTKYYQRLQKNTDFKFLNELNNSDDKFSVVIFGHSLSENDQDFIKEIFNFKTVNQIHIFYKNQLDKSQKIRNLLKINGRSKVEDLMRNEKLFFVEINSKNLNNLFDKLPKSSEKKLIIG